MERRKFRIWLPLLLSISMVIGMYLGYKMRDGMPTRSFFYMERHKPIQEIIDLVKSKYVDDVDENVLGDTAITAVLAKLDPHSYYLPARSVEQSNEELAGSFYGIGIEFNLFEDTLNVTNVLRDGPGFKAGLQIGDKFLQANDSVLTGKNKGGESIRKILKGNKGTTLNLLILRKDKKINIHVSRDYIPVTSVDAAYMVDSSIGYIRLNKFSQKTYREFMQSLEKLKKAGLKKLILDLRGNGGGVLDEAVEIADEFLEGDRLITYTEGKHFPRKEYRSRRQGQFEKEPLVILADEASASASEILLGALQDWDRASIIGRRTFGKGLVQEQFDLSDNSAVRLTVSRYYTPLGRSIQRSYAAGSKAYYDEIQNRLMTGDNIADSILHPKAKKYRTKNGKLVYESGGITPDYYIAEDTARLGKIISKIFSKGLLNNFGYKYVVDHALLLEQYKTPADFAKSFFINAEGWNYFLLMAKKDSTDVTEINNEERTFLYKTLKLAIAQQLWRHDGYFIVFNKDDKGVMKAIEVLSK